MNPRESQLGYPEYITRQLIFTENFNILMHEKLVFLNQHFPNLVPTMGGDAPSHILPLDVQYIT